MATRAGMVLNGGIGKRLLNVREAAEYLGLEIDTVYKKARLRELPSVKVGRALRFDVVKLNRYIEQQTIETVD
jgi:excisionase family DNA binding protein